MIIARPLVVGVDEIWRPQPPGVWGVHPPSCLRIPPLRVPCLAAATAPVRRWLPRRTALPWVLGGRDCGSVPLAAGKPECSTLRQYPVLEFILWGAERPLPAAANRAAVAVSPESLGKPKPGTAEEAVLPASPAASSTAPAPALANDAPASAVNAVGAQCAQPPTEEAVRVLNSASLLASGAGSESPCAVGDDRPPQRQDSSEWSMISFSSLRTDESVELSESVDSSSSSSAASVASLRSRRGRDDSQTDGSDDSGENRSPNVVLR
eukprot:TRINITY_DN10539_c0_g2_i3.p1 TRINITY_DN10539_c0_g2~~TRINITY_DN10539_c0_g2_i3.p1  ORF type:complete len:266 (+),score=34.14 TRINITY_DN10539_c0_g2_i3:209-1006(+)